jgi:hypothetical protein
MLRRSAPILPGLVVCLFAVYPSGATSTLRLDESRIRVSLEHARTNVSLEVESGESRTFGARVSVTLVDPRDKVRAEAAADVSVRAGKNSFSVLLKLPYSELLEAERKEFPWYRLRYRVAPEGGAAVSAIEGVVSLSEVTPDLFELRVITSQKARPGSQLRARVQAVNPVSGRAVKGVAVAGELKFDEDLAQPSSKASAVTGGDGFATLDFHRLWREPKPTHKPLRPSELHRRGEARPLVLPRRSERRSRSTRRLSIRPARQARHRARRAAGGRASLVVPYSPELRDPWGQLYSFEFGVSGAYYSINVRSSGPNKSFERHDASDSDDFTLWTTLTDYFAETRAVCASRSRTTARRPR